MRKVIDAQAVSKKFGDFVALKSLDLQVTSGECLGLLGPNGAGKSTFIGTLYGAIRRSSGSLNVFGLDPLESSQEIKKYLGVVPQENALDEGLTVVENLRVYAGFLGITNQQQKEARIKDGLDYMLLSQKRDVMIRALSGGMKRRLAFVRALLGVPELLILDEPTTGLDPGVRHLLWEKVGDLKRLGKTILLTTHYIHEAEVLCDRVVIMDQGRVVDCDEPRKLIEQHAPGFVGIFPQESQKQVQQFVQKNWDSYEQSQQFCVRTPRLEDLLELQKASGVLARQLRPSSLEDVFLKLTGSGLDSES